MSRNYDDDNGLLWKLPVIKSQEIGKLGPGFGFGVGCGVGNGVGLFGGAGLGIGFPGLRFGVGIGLGFGYGLGKGIAYDEDKRHSNVGKLFKRSGAARSLHSDMKKHNSLAVQSLEHTPVLKLESILCLSSGERAQMFRKGG